MATEYFQGAERIDIGNGQELDLYRARDVSITIIRQDGTTVILRNFQDGDMVSGEKTNNKVDGISDAQGSPAGAVQYDHLGSMTTNLQLNSTSNQIMSDLYNSDEVFGFIVNYGHEQFGGSHCMIQKAPTAPLGKTVPIRQWVATVFDYEYDGNRN